MLELILKHTRKLRTLLVFVDALNESSQSEKVLRAILELEKQASNIRVMLTSTLRPLEIDMQNCPGITEVTMSHKLTLEDIQAYVDTQLEERPGLCHLTESAKEHIKSVLLEKADGMYYPAHLV